MTITKNLLTPNKYSRPQTKLAKVKGIAVHYVGNANSTAVANRNYFESLKNGVNGVYASSHYIIGLNGEIIQCVPENEIAYCTNARNVDTLSIECCHPKTDGKFNEQTYRSLIELSADICNRYGLNPATDMIRHYDVTKKMCPLWYVNNPKDWEQLKVDVKNKLMEGIEMESVMKVTINSGSVATIPSILKDGRNYPNLQELAKLLNVGVAYDANTKVVNLTT